MSMIISALWGAAAVALLIHAIRVSYRIEAIVRGDPPGTIRWRYANVIGHAFNVSVPGTPECQALRGKLVRSLLIIVLGFVAIAVYLATIGTFTPPPSS